MKKALKGFTLVELVITIAVIIVLSAISVPIYKNYTKKAKYAEAYVLLGVLREAEKTYYNQYGTFYWDENHASDYTSHDDVLGVDARGNKYFTKFIVPIKSDNGFLSEVSAGDVDGLEGVLMSYGVTSGATYMLESEYN